jgi:hypothetical protein
MAGHIAGLGYSQRMDINGVPLAGAKLYIYDAGTSTPATVFTDYSLSIEHTHPIEADAAGIIPMFWVDDGSYRVRLTDIAGNEVFNDDNIVALGPSSGDSGSASVTTPAEAIAQTGDFIWNAVSGARTGWVRANGRTIGSAASGATERASADTDELFVFLWNNFSNSLCAVSSGRGANAAADFAANKTIATLDMRDKGAFGLSDMGNTSTGLLSTTGGATGGATTVTLAQTNLPTVNFTHSLTAATHTHAISGTTSTGSANHTHTGSGTTSSDGDHDHNAGNDQSTNLGGGGGVATLRTTAEGDQETSVEGDHTHTYSFTTSSSGASHTHTFSDTSSASGALAVAGTVSSGGSATAVNKMPPWRVGTWYIKL